MNCEFCGIFFLLVVCAADILECARELNGNWLWHDFCVVIFWSEPRDMSRLVVQGSFELFSQKAEKGQFSFEILPELSTWMSFLVAGWIISCFDFTKCRVNGLLFSYWWLVLWTFFMLSTVSVSSFFPRFERVLSNVSSFVSKRLVLPYRGPFKSCLRGSFYSKYFHVLRLTKVISMMFNYEFYRLWVQVILSVATSSYFLDALSENDFFFFVFNRGENINYFLNGSAWI